MKHHFKNQQGFTIMEVVIVIALFSVILLGLLGLFDWHHKIFILEQADVRATSSVRNVMNNMTKYVAQATNFEASHTISGTTYTTDGDCVVVKVPTVNTSGNLVDGVFDYIAYCLVNGNVDQVTEAGVGSARVGGSKRLADNVLTFSLTYNNATVTAASTVTVDIQSRVTIKSSSTANARAVDTIFLRNR